MLNMVGFIDVYGVSVMCGVCGVWCPYSVMCIVWCVWCGCGVYSVGVACCQGNFVP